MRKTKRVISTLLSILIIIGCFAIPTTAAASGTITNIAPNATPSTSYCSPWETLEAIQFTTDPENSGFITGDQYGNWSEQGTQWVQYDFQKTQVISSSKVYWAEDGGGVLCPKSAVMQYWNGGQWVDIAPVDVQIDKYNEITFEEIATKKVRLQFESNGASTGIKRWQVYGYESEIQLNEAPTVNAGLGYYTILPNKMLLTSTVIDDGLPEGNSVTTTWTQVQGPSEAVIEKPNELITYATATVPGKYVFKVTANDGELEGSATTYVNVYDEEGKYGNPILPGMFPDPHIMYDNGKFYIYATSMENDAGSYGRASVWVSEDFVNWEMQLTNYPVYGEFGGDIWAPDIVKVNDKYYQFITRSGYYDTTIAVSDSPVGPWENVREDGKAIVGGSPDVADTVIAAYNMDSHPFVDDDGSVYMYWGWSESMVAKLTPDLKSIDGEVTFLKGTKWVAESGDHPQSLTVDLGADYAIDEIRTSPEFRDIIYKYKIEISSDNETWNLYSDKSNNNVACGDTYYSDKGEGTGRYVRITILDSQGNWASLYDFSVYSNGEKISLNKPVEATSNRGAGSEPENAVDNMDGPYLTDYVEAPYVIKRNGIYYLLYSSGALHDGTYSVHYAMSDNPLGPFITPENNVILKSNEEETTKGPGHNSVLFFEDEYYIVYHQHNQPHVDGGGVFRQTAADKLEFNEDGTIKPVVPTQTGVGALLPYQDPGNDLARGKYATATSVRDANSVAEYALDHNNASKWKAADNSYPQSLTVDLEKLSDISRIETAFEYPTLSYKYKIETSIDGNIWETYVDKTSEFPTAVCPHKDYKDVQARFVRITITECQRPENNAGIYTFKVFGEEAETPVTPEITVETEKSVYQANSVFTVNVNTPADVADISFSNEYGKDMGKSIVDIVENDDGSITWKYNLSIGTKGDRKINVNILNLETGEYEYATDFTVKIVDSIALEEIEAQLISAEISDGSRIQFVGQNFEITAITNKGVSDLKIVNEYGNDIGKTLISKEIDGDNIIWKYSLNIGTKGRRTITVMAADKDYNWLETTKDIQITIVK